MAEEVKHYQVNQKYRVKFEKAAGVKTGDGFAVEANGDDLDIIISQAEALYREAQKVVALSVKGGEL